MKEKKSMREIACALADNGNPNHIFSFLESLLTQNEIREISSRWELVKLLDQGYSQRQIAHRLGLSLCKITRGSRELKRKNSAFKRMIAGKGKKSVIAKQDRVTRSTAKSRRPQWPRKG